MAEHTGTLTIAWPLPGSGAHGARRLLAWAATSLLLHVLLLALPHDLLHRVLPQPIKALEVSLVAPQPVTVKAPPREPPAPKHEARPRVVTPAASLPVLTAPSPAPATQDARIATAAPSEAVEPPRAAPEPRQQAALRESTPVTPPNFNAAYLQNPPPRYPLAARRNGDHGTVTLKVLVTREGLAASVAVERSSGSSLLDSTALESVKGWRFVPARQGAQPVEAWVLVPVVFKLEGPG